MTDLATPGRIIDFWCVGDPRAWFCSEAAFDRSVREQFEALHLKASLRGLESWRAFADGALGHILLLGQFPGTSTVARPTPSQPALSPGRSPTRPSRTASTGFLQPFFYLLFERHEDAASQTRSVALFKHQADRSERADYRRFALRSVEPISRFGRFQHCNALLGRSSTREELDDLTGGGLRG